MKIKKFIAPMAVLVALGSYLNYRMARTIAIGLKIDNIKLLNQTTRLLSYVNPDEVPQELLDDIEFRYITTISETEQYIKKN